MHCTLKIHTLLSIYYKYTLYSIHCTVQINTVLSIRIAHFMHFILQNAKHSRLIICCTMNLASCRHTTINVYALYTTQYNTIYTCTLNTIQNQIDTAHSTLDTACIIHSMIIWNIGEGVNTFIYVLLPMIYNTKGGINNTHTKRWTEGKQSKQEIKGTKSKLLC